VRAPYYRDDSVRLFVGDAAEVLRELPAGSVDCVVTSPPYWGRRDYRHPGQLGLEATPELYIHRLSAVFAELARVLSPTGTCWLNLADCYSGSWGNYAAHGSPAAARQDPARIRRYGTFKPPQAVLPAKKVPGKNLLGLPWRVALRLQEHGWIIRNSVVWHKPNAMPESVRDRLSTRYELIFLLVRQERYWFDLDAVRELYTGDRPLARRARKSRRGAGKPNSIATPPNRPPNWPPVGGSKYVDAAGPLNGRQYGSAASSTGRRQGLDQEIGRNPGDVWTQPTRPFPGPHFAVQPVDIPLRCIAAGCPPGGTVLDPFSGAGTTVLAARALGRAAVGIDLRSDFHDLTLQRLEVAGSEAADTSGGAS
jgi:DNA modification methylase